jgi:hypothetical protein
MDIFKVSILVYLCIIVTVIIVTVAIYFYSKYKIKRQRKESQNKTYKYKSYKLKLVKNTLGVKKSIYWLLKVKFREVIEAENKALGFEYVKPFDFTKLREQKVLVSDVLTALVIVSEKKELLPQILSLFVVDSKNYNFDYEKDYNELSVLAGELLTDFFYENLEKMP